MAKLTRRWIKIRAALLQEISASLEGGKTPYWGDGPRMSRIRVLRELGVELVSRTSMKRKGHVLKRSQRPVVIGYYGRPLCRDVELFVLGVQTKPEGK